MRLRGLELSGRGKDRKAEESFERVKESPDVQQDSKEVCKGAHVF